MKVSYSCDICVGSWLFIFVLIIIEMVQPTKVT